LFCFFLLFIVIFAVKENHVNQQTES